MDHVDEAGIGGLHLPDEKHRPGRLGNKVELLGPHIDVAQQNIVRNDVLDKGGFVVLLLIIGLGTVEGHGSHGAHHPGLPVLPLGKGGIIKLGAPAGQGLEGTTFKLDRLSLPVVDRLHCAGPMLPDAAEFVASHHRSLRIDHTYRPVCAVLHL